MERIGFEPFMIQILIKVVTEIPDGDPGNKK